MGYYARRVLPRLIDVTCRLAVLTEQRRQIVPRARGRVLEIGVGSGLNFAFYDPAGVDEVLGVDPSRQLQEWASVRAQHCAIAYAPLLCGAESIPLPDASIDTIVTTYCLCSIARVQESLRESARVLRPGGQLLFCEHGRAEHEAVRRWQDRLTPVWRRVAGGCHLNRPILTLIETAGLRICEAKVGYLPGSRNLSHPFSYHFRGVAERY